MSVYGISGQAMKGLIDKYKPQLDKMWEPIKPGSKIIKTSLIFRFNNKEFLEICYQVRGQFINPYPWNIAGKDKLEERHRVIHVAQTQVMTMPHCCGIMIMSGGSTGLPESLIKKTTDSHIWTLFTEMVFEYAKLAGYGRVLATDQFTRTAGIAKRLGVNTIAHFKNPRTKNPIDLYFKDIT